jgi:hypothetical protein
MALTQVDGGLLSPINGQFYSMKNRLINGAMMIDQRNAGASVTPTSSSYTLDRWQMDIGLASKFSVQQVSDAPAGFINSIKLTVVSSYTPASDAMFFRQNIEGFNVADLGYGTSSAQPIAISFWVKASVTGTYSVTIGNNANNYSYISTYTVSSANTWQYITLTLVGPTAGTWLTNSNTGLRLKFDIGSGSNYNGTAGVWSAADVGRTSSSVVLGSNAGATWQITGVQLEKGSTATSFDYRPYGTELALCQRYYETINAGLGGASGNLSLSIGYKVEKRSSPTLTRISSGLGAYAAPTTTLSNSITFYMDGSGTNIGGLYSAAAEL